MNGLSLRFASEPKAELSAESEEWGWGEGEENGFESAYSDLERDASHSYHGTEIISYGYLQRVHDEPLGL